MAGALIQRAFAGGELAPSVYARGDLPRYQQGLRTCRNFIVQRQGGVANRGGTKTLGAIKSETGWIAPYIETGVYDSVTLEFGENSMRVWYLDDTRLEVTAASAWSAVTTYAIADIVSSGGVFYYAKAVSLNQAPPNSTYWHPLPANGSNGIYEVPTPWPSGVRNSITWEQSGGVLSFADVSYPPQELRRLGEESWSLTQVVTGPDIAAPANLLVSAGSIGLLVHNYVVTAVAEDTYEESAPCPFFQLAMAGTPTELAPHVLTWDAVAGAVEYRIYKDPFYNGTYGFIGVATGQESFNDVGLAPDFLQAPPIQRDLFNVSNAYPAVVAVCQQRRWYGRTGAEPEKIWGSQIGFPSNFNIRSPLQDDDAVSFELTNNHSQVVRWLLDMSKLVVLTESGEWLCNGDEGGTVLPTDINPKQHGYAGAKNVKPLIVGSTLIFLQARGSIIRDLQFDRQVEGISGRDLTVFSAHLFDGYTITRIAYQQNPHSVIWCVRSDGALLGLTYMPEHDVWGWHRHDTGEDEGDVIEDVCVVPDGDEDKVFILVTRGDNGRYIERLVKRQLGDDAWYVDAGVEAEDVDTVTGLDHLEGRVVAVYADGQVLYNGDPDGDDAASWTVSGGELALGAEYEQVLVGLRVRYQLETLDPDVPGSDLRNRKKRTQGVTLLVEASSRTFWAGPDSEHMLQYRKEVWEPASSSEVTKPLEMNITGKFDLECRTIIEQRDPLPLTVLGLMPFVEVGG
jgi:hypothetical protein